MRLHVLESNICLHNSLSSEEFYTFTLQIDSVDNDIAKSILKCKIANFNFLHIKFIPDFARRKKE